MGILGNHFPRMRQQFGARPRWEFGPTIDGWLSPQATSRDLYVQQLPEYDARRLNNPVLVFSLSSNGTPHLPLEHHKTPAIARAASRRRLPFL